MFKSKFMIYDISVKGDIQFLLWGNLNYLRSRFLVDLAE